MNSESLKLSDTTPHVHSNAVDHFQDTITTHPSHKQQHKMQNIEDILREYDAFGDSPVDDGQSVIEDPAITEDHKGHKSVSVNDNGSLGVTEKTGNENEPDHASDSMDDHITDNTDDHVTDNANDEMKDHTSEHVTENEVDHMTDGMDDHMADHMTDNVDHHSSKEEKKLKEKTKEEALWDSEEKLREQLARKKKQKRLKKKKEKLKEKYHSGEILKDFDELKKQNTKTSEKANREVEGNRKLNRQKAGKHIKYVHADESQVAGDAILDFLDKLLEKDPKELKHDVLAMTKEMQKEGKCQLLPPLRNIHLKA